MAAYPVIFNFQDDGQATRSERMNILASLPRQERPALLDIVKDPSRHTRVLWGIKKNPFSYAVAGDTPPRIAIDNERWNLEDHHVPSQLTAASDINKIQPEDICIPQAVTVT